MYPYKKKSKKSVIDFIWKDLSTHDFPKITDREDLFIKTEREFHLLINCSKSIQRSLGWSGIINSNVFYPDVQALLSDCGEIIKIELEYEASNFIKHDHSGRNCDLIISFIRKPEDTLIRGLPVWSFYTEKRNQLVWSLQHDIINNCGIDELDYGFSLDESQDD